MIGGEEGDYILQVRGDSMRDAASSRATRGGRPAEDADDGEIVVALIEEEATVKRFFKEGDHVRLSRRTGLEPILTRTRRSSAG